jgi:intracellular sulfur oxidation DsrE/DsrF family protein
MQRRPLVLLSLLLLAPWTLPSVAQESPYAPQKVVYHVNFDGGEGNKHYLATLRNVQNHINAVGEDRLDLRVVMNGNGLHLLMNANDDADLGQRVSNLKAQGVRFLVCRNTMEGRDIKLEDLYDAWEEDIVPSGVAEVAKLQQEGFALIKTY